MANDDDGARRAIPIARETDTPKPMGIMALAVTLVAIMAGLAIAVHVTTP